ncbi:CoA pyrophosphatase [Frateuria aurantia]
MSEGLEPLWARLHALDAAPAGPAWNHAEFADDGQPTALRRAAVLVGLRRLPQPRLILTVRTATLQAHAGQVAFPGGRVDPDDVDVVATAMREADEEVGLASRWVEPLGYLDRFETLSGYLITPVVAWVDPEASCIPQPAEVAEVFEVPLSFLRDPANLKQLSVSYRGRRRELVEFHYQGYRIWGATAAILHRWLMSGSPGQPIGFQQHQDQHV